jgi:hypothetical protein
MLGGGPSVNHKTQPSTSKHMETQLLLPQLVVLSPNLLTRKNGQKDQMGTDVQLFTDSGGSLLAVGLYQDWVSHQRHYAATGGRFLIRRSGGP